MCSRRWTLSNKYEYHPDIWIRELMVSLERSALPMSWRQMSNHSVMSSLSRMGLKWNLIDSISFIVVWIFRNDDLNLIFRNVLIWVIFFWCWFLETKSRILKSEIFRYPVRRFVPSYVPFRYSRRFWFVFVKSQEKMETTPNNHEKIVEFHWFL